MSAPDSPFYPPRAGRGLAFRRLWEAYRRRVPTLLRFVPDRVKSFDAPWLVVPVMGIPFLGLHLASPPLVRKIGKILAVLGVALAIIYFDLIVGRVALGLLTAIHALGVCDYLQMVFPTDSAFRRAARRAVLTVVYTLLVIDVAPRAMEHFVIRVAAKNGRVVLINPRDRVPPHLLGAPVAFHCNGIGVDHMQIYPGRYLGNMIARGGEKVKFAPDLVRVNGVAHPASPLLPHRGELTVPPGHVFVWPQGIYLANVGDDSRLRIANGFVIPYSALVGRPYTRWFWRTLPPPSP